MKKICIYHGFCDDGFGATYAVWKKHRDDVEYYPGVYQQDPPDVTGKDVILVDFSYERTVLTVMIEKCNSMLILDHHKTAEADLQGIFANPKVLGEFDMHRSGAMMAWEWFHPNEAVPELIQHIQDRDLWRFKLPGTKQISMALRSYPQDFKLWDKFMRLSGGNMDEFMSEGITIERFYNQKVEEAAKHAGDKFIGGFTVLSVNAPAWMASDLATLLCEQSGKEFAAVYWVDADDNIKYSLRSRGDFDVSIVAKIYGGGGHKNAAGFTVKGL